MKLFIGWSGALSKRIAEVLREHIGKVNPYIEPFVSTKDIAIGSPWESELFRELKSANYGILCMTGDNLSALWLFYEAGVLSLGTSMNNPNEQSRVAPIQFSGERAGSLKGPLAHFQSGSFSRDMMWRLTREMNALCRKLYAISANEEEKETYLKPKKLKAKFDADYERLEQEIRQILESALPPSAVTETNYNTDKQNVTPPPSAVTETLPIPDKRDRAALFAKEVENLYSSFPTYSEVQRVYAEGQEVLKCFNHASGISRWKACIHFYTILKEEVIPTLKAENERNFNMNRQKRILAMEKLLEITEEF